MARLPVHPVNGTAGSVLRLAAGSCRKLAGSCMPYALLCIAAKYGWFERVALNAGSSRVAPLFDTSSK